MIFSPLTLYFPLCPVISRCFDNNFRCSAIFWLLLTHLDLFLQNYIQNRVILGLSLDSIPFIYLYFLLSFLAILKQCKTRNCRSATFSLIQGGLIYLSLFSLNLNHLLPFFFFFQTRFYSSLKITVTR